MEKNTSRKARVFLIHIQENRIFLVHIFYMKHQALTLAIVLLLISACNKKSEKGIAGHLYKFEETSSRKNFCNPDSIALSGCAGDFYFTKAGHVFFTYSCEGEDSITYLVGNYFEADSMLTKCSFVQKYSVAVNPGKGSKISGFEADMNSGTLKKMAPAIVRLNRLKCEKFQYYFIANGRYPLRYVLSEPSKEYEDNYLSRISEVKSFRGM